jgi:hypothetical protein
VPHPAVAVDTSLLRVIPALPAHRVMSGLVYDVATGLVEGEKESEEGTVCIKLSGQQVPIRFHDN